MTLCTVKEVRLEPQLWLLQYAWLQHFKTLKILKADENCPHQFCGKGNVGADVRVG